MARAALVLVHGRSQQMPAASRGGVAEEAAFVLQKKHAWLAGLAKGLVLAGLPAVDEKAVYFPYYGNTFADEIARRERAGLDRPDLEMAPPPRPASADALILDSAQLLGFTPEREAMTGEAGGVEAEAEEAWRAYTEEGLEADFGPLLRSRLLRAALQYIARKTGATELVIERFLTDVAYYLEVEDIRRLVLDTVMADVRRAAEEHGRVVVVAHSLGSIVGFDLFDGLDDALDIPLFVTAGAPLGFPVVQRNLHPSAPAGTRAGPTRNGAPLPWLNAFDVRDFVALVHPLGNFYTGDLRDERTFNPSDPHSIADSLADPDVARPIGRALAGRPPW
jgi:hypothetical protein